MAYTLDQFCTDARSILKVAAARRRAAESRGAPERASGQSRLRRRDLLRRHAGRQRELFHDPELDFHVLAHVQEGGKTGRPHSHGTSWAIYGNAKNVTEMTEYRRVNPESEENVVLEPASKYALRPGQTRAYGPNVIHSTAHPQKAWVIRVTGTDLDKLPRYHLRKQDRCWRRRERLLALLRAERVVAAR